MLKKYKLVKPFISDKIHTIDNTNYSNTQPVVKGAKKCYSELKQFNLPSNINTFTIKDIDSNQIFKFKINNSHIGGGGKCEDGKDEDGNPCKKPKVTEGDEPEENTLDSLHNELVKINEKIEKLESCLGCKGYEKKNDTCVVM